MTLVEALTKADYSVNKFAVACDISKTQILRLLNHGFYPARMGADEVKRRVTNALTSRGLDLTDLVWPGNGGYRPTNPVWQQRTEGLDLMSLDKNVLQHFSLRYNPFQNDINADDDVLRFRGYESVETAIRETVDQRGFLAIIADSGSGKTTIWDGIEAEYATRSDIVICKPQLKNKDQMTPDHIARALIYGLGGGDVSIRANAEDRGRQLSQLLRGIREGAVDRKAVLYIDDAHFCSQSVLRQLKTFFEEKVGRFRLMSIILVGLPTLKEKLTQFAEIGNRIRLIEVPPVNVQEYLAFKLERAGSGVERLFDESGLAAFTDRFRAAPRRPPLGRPLVVNAMCIRAMCRLVANGPAKDERITREIIDQLPGEGSSRKVAA